MSKMENFIAVQDKTEGIIGKFLYYSTSNILIKRDKFIEIGQSFGLPKFKPAKESKSGAYRNATTAIKDRIRVKDGGGTQVYAFTAGITKRRTLSTSIASLSRKRWIPEPTTTKARQHHLWQGNRNNVLWKRSIWPGCGCERILPPGDGTPWPALHLLHHRSWESVIQDQLDRMQANKISIHGNLAFIPNPYLPSAPTFWGLYRSHQQAQSERRPCYEQQHVCGGRWTAAPEDDGWILCQLQTGYRILSAAHPAFYRQRL